MADSSLRQRKSKLSRSPKGTTQDVISAVEDTDRFLSPLDILRVFLTLMAVCAAFSYYLTAGSSFLLGYNLKLSTITQLFRSNLQLTPEQLSLYNGTDPRLPIYLAINGTVFDVSAGRHAYGPGGSYSVFAGKDATRAYVTGCFADDTTGDMRGAEEIYMFIDEPEAEESSVERKMRLERERREARKRVRKEVEKWEKFYKDHKKYFQVGKVAGGEMTLADAAPTLCASAQKGRPKRKKRKTNRQDTVDTPGKPVQ